MKKTRDAREPLSTVAASGIEPLVSVKDVSRLLRVKTRTLRDWIAQGELPAVRLSDRILRLRLSDVRRFVEERSTSTAAPSGAKAETSHG